MDETVTITKAEWEWTRAMADMAGLLAAYCAFDLFDGDAPAGDHDLVTPHIHRLQEAAGADPKRRWLVAALEELLAGQPARSFHAPPPAGLATEPEC